MKDASNSSSNFVLLKKAKCAYKVLTGMHVSRGGNSYMIQYFKGSAWHSNQVYLTGWSVGFILATKPANTTRQFGVQVETSNPGNKQVRFRLGPRSWPLVGSQPEPNPIQPTLLPVNVRGECIQRDLKVILIHFDGWDGPNPMLKSMSKLPFCPIEKIKKS